MTLNLLQVRSFGAETHFGASAGEAQLSVVSGSSGAVGYAQYPAEFHWPNRSLRKALAEIEIIQAGMKVSSGEDTVDVLRKARAGALYGIE